MTLKGETTLQLIDPRSKRIVRQVKKHNTITGAAARIYQGGLWADLGLNGVTEPLDFFGGIFLTDRAIGSTPTSLPAGVNLTAHAGQINPETGDTNLKRGTPNLTESGPLMNGYRRVWDWGTDRANGPIGAACLTHSVNGYNGFLNNEILAAKSLITARKKFPDYQAFICLDPENNRYFTVHLSGTDITINEYSLAFTACRIVADHTLLTSRTVTTSLTMTEDYQASCQIADGFIYYSFVPQNGHQIRLCTIKISDWSVTDETLTVNSSITLSNNSISYKYCKNCIYKGYIYIPATSSSVNGFSVYKINLSDPTDVELLESSNNETVWAQYGFITMVPLNDYIYVIRPYDGRQFFRSFIIDTVKNTISDAPRLFTAIGFNDLCFGAVNFRNNLITLEGSAYTNNQINSAVSPSMITTVNDLPSVLTKTADLALKVTYTLTEGAA